MEMRKIYKKYCNFPEHGMIVADREKAKDILKRVNYYRFTGYALQFRQESSGSDYIEGTTFETVYHLIKIATSYVHRR